MSVVFRRTGPELDALSKVLEDQRAPEDVNSAALDAWAAQRGWNACDLNLMAVHAAKRHWPLPEGGFTEITVLRHPFLAVGGEEMLSWQDRTTTPDRERLPSLARWLHPPRQALERALGGAAMSSPAPIVGLEYFRGDAGALKPKLLAKSSVFVICEGMSDWLTLTYCLSPTNAEDASEFWIPLSILGASNMKKAAQWLPFGEDHRVLIVADRDPAGAEAARSLLGDLRLNGTQTMGVIPRLKDLTEDWADDSARLVTSLQSAVKERSRTEPWLL